jgi:hypothetical protein
MSRVGEARRGYRFLVLKLYESVFLLVFWHVSLASSSQLRYHKDQQQMHGDETQDKQALES